MQQVGPLRLRYDGGDEKIMIPLATYETPLWPSTARGARVSTVSGGICCTLVDDRMARSILVEGPDAASVHAVAQALTQRRDELEARTRETGRFVQLLDVHSEQTANLLFLRFAFSTGDASGHNMATQAADHLQTWILEQYPELQYISVSGNTCCDKKVSAINGILGRGKHVIAELCIPEKICRRYLKTTPQKMAALNLKKNLIGSLLAGGVRSANAHFANILLAFYLATGQDAANIVEGSQGITYAEAREDGLYFSVTLPNLIVGSVGAGKGLDFVRENLEALGCQAPERAPGGNAQRLAAICAAAVLCGELSLLAALSNPGELMDAHLRLERA